MTSWTKLKLSPPMPLLLLLPLLPLLAGLELFINENWLVLLVFVLLTPTFIFIFMGTLMFIFMGALMFIFMFILLIVFV